MRYLVVALGLAVAGSGAHAQEFVPPDRRPGSRPTAEAAPVEPPTGGGFRAGVLGFTTRGGAQVNQGSQVVLGSTVDLAQLGSPRLRLRPSFEVGFGSPSKSLGINLEVVYRFQDDGSTAIPYLGAGAGYYDDDATERGWATVVIGFELPFRRGMSWLFEYHALDGVGRSRVLAGLATRAGGR